MKGMGGKPESAHSFKASSVGRKHGLKRSVHVLIDEDIAERVADIATKYERSPAWILRKACGLGIDRVEELLDIDAASGGDK